MSISFRKIGICIHPPAFADKETPIPEKSASKQQALRASAEDRLLSEKAGPSKCCPPEDSLKLLHELHVHQIELEMQNEELRSKQRELEIAREHYFELYEFAPVGYLTLNREGRILEANLTATTLLSVERTALLKQPFSRLVHPSDRDVFQSDFSRLLTTDIRQKIELRIRHKGDMHLWLHIHAQSGIDRDTGLMVCKMVLSDITWRKQADDELRLAMDISKRLNSSMDRLLHTVAHEFRTPLGLLTGCTDVLENYRNSLSIEKQTEYFDRIRNAAQQLSNLLHSVTSFNRLGTDRPEGQPAALNVSDICRAIATQVETVWSSGQRFIITVADDCGCVMLHECLLHRILENLLTNAFRYTSPEGRIQLNIRRELSLLVMEITDTGIGIGKEDLKLIFNPFHRGRNVEGRRGLGMGLSIVQENLTLLHGTITVSSSVQTGSTFLVKIPVDASSNASESDQLLEVMKRDT